MREKNKIKTYFLSAEHRVSFVFDLLWLFLLTWFHTKFSHKSFFHSVSNKSFTESVTLIMRGCFLTSDWGADEVGDGVEEVDHAQCRGQVLRSHQVRRHHGDQRHIGAIEVTVEDGEGQEEREGLEQWHEEAAETLHRHGEDVTRQSVRLQTPERKTQLCFKHLREETRLCLKHLREETRDVTHEATSCPSASRTWCSLRCWWLPGWTWGRRRAGGRPRHSERRAPGRWTAGCSRWPGTGRTQPCPGSPAAAGSGTP